jgi:hypothetical protein
MCGIPILPEPWPVKCENDNILVLPDGPKLGMDPTKLLCTINGKVMSTRAGRPVACEGNSSDSNLQKLTAEIRPV